ncbi:protein SEED AND ROOT HAIR PROTECTIVE PROTEIN [Gossypium hirsutum]|uniref:Protein SEED AND ROOT HAIR PROTECTIVE PROTEIN n=1 Tax=Gossypium hirsutum TaxID=3635 RepID=A0A1U8J105_GOSHI|nr:protein SEED AND ROOT HAIR PROTECTIVE PROTEIN-like [Gossypium hirsutum]
MLHCSPAFNKEKEELLSIGVEGIVLYKSGSNYYPMAGALGKVKCVAVDEVGLGKTVPICSVAFLEKSPLESCNVPIDVNKGISGAPFSGYRVLNQKHTKLYSLGPFFFTSGPKSVRNGY